MGRLSREISADARCTPSERYGERSARGLPEADGQTSFCTAGGQGDEGRVGIGRPANAQPSQCTLSEQRAVEGARFSDARRG
jgi:hypothetical protein